MKKQVQILQKQNQYALNNMKTENHVDLITYQYTQ